MRGATVPAAYPGGVSRRALCRALGASLGLGPCLVGAGRAAGAPAPAVLREAALPTSLAVRAALLSVVSAGPGRLVAAGERGIVIVSDDAGRSWHQAQVPVQVTLTALQFADARTGWAVGHGGVILRTDDGGLRWTLQLDGVRAAALALEAAQAGGDEHAVARARRHVEEGPDKPFLDLDFLDARRGIAVGAYGLAFETDDGGAHWRPCGGSVPDPKGLHLYAVRRQGARAWIAGEQGLLLRAEDGAAFAPLDSPYKGSFFGLLLARTGTLVAFGLRGHAFRSTDQGASWEAIDTGVPVSISGGVDLGVAGLALVTQAGDLLVSRDDGRAFVPVPSAVPVPATSIAPAGDGDVVIASLRGPMRVALPQTRRSA